MSKWGEKKIRIVNLLAETPNLLEREIAESLGISQPMVNKHLEGLRSLGVVRVERRPRWSVAKDRGVPVIRTAGSA